MSKKLRNLGKNYALAWKTGAKTHLTLIYFNNVKRGFEQERVKALAIAFLNENNIAQHITLNLGDMMTDRCILVLNEEILRLQQQLYVYFEALGFDLRALKPPHIDTRGDADDVQVVVETRFWNY